MLNFLNGIEFGYIIILLFWICTGTVHAQELNEQDLSEIYKTGFILQDSDGDSLPDVVDVQLLLSDSPGAAEVIGAANIAARLGYETTAMDLDLVHFLSRESFSVKKPAVIIGHSNKFGIPKWDQQNRNLVPGQGIIRWLPPDNRFQKGGVQLVGEDATGLIAVSNYFSGLYPGLQKAGGRTLSDVKHSIYETAESDTVQIESLSMYELQIEEGKKGISSIKIDVIVSDGASFDRISSLKSVDEADEEQQKRRNQWTTTLTEGGIYRAELMVQFGEQSEMVRFVSSEPQPESPGEGESTGGGRSFDLHQMYSIDGLFRDTNSDGVPDDMPAYISYAGNDSPRSLIKFAARIGLETAGVRLPLVYPARDTDHPERDGFPILTGINHYMVERLQEDGKNFYTLSGEGAGAIEMAENAFDETHALVITGSDENGLDAALDYASERLPYLWEYGKGNWELKDIQTEVRRFLQGVEGPGQVAAGLEKLNVWLERIEDSNPESLEIELSAEKLPDNLEPHIEQIVNRYFPDVNPFVRTYHTGFGSGEPVFEENIEIPWEVDEFWEYFDNELLPQLDSGSEGEIVVRLSESPEIREQIRQQILEKLQQKGIGGEAIEVTILSAYKQGFSWLNDHIVPQLREEDVGNIEITYYNLRDSNEIRWQAVDSDTRWLQEIYPIDGVFMRELNVPDSAITFHETYTDDPVYRIKAFDNRGEQLLEETFNPKYAVRPFFDLFPEYDSVRVTTGWVEANINGSKIADRRIKTDLERFWDHLQTDTYGKILEYVMDIQEGRPESSLAPYFDEFKLQVTLSEPNYELGILKEQISPLEALHEDIYFETLLLFRLIGNRYGVGSLSYPGRILPYIMPPEHGKPGKAQIEFTGKQEGRPLLTLRYRKADGEPEQLRYELPNLRTDDPEFQGISLNKNTEGLSSLLFNVAVDKDENLWEAFKQRGSEEYIDRTFVSAERLKGMISALQEMQSDGIFENVLSYDRIGELNFRFTIEDSTEYSETAVLPRSANPVQTEVTPLVDADFEYRGQNLVQWERPISPEENHEIIAKLNTFDNINAYYMATSLLGRDVYAMDLLPPTPSKYRSQAKMNALKPTLFISGRQHANEFSSTSHMLKLAEKIATEPDYQKYLNKVNLVLHPMTNPDGAALAVDLHNINPTHMHHAGYLGPLGVDITRDQGNRDPRYEVANVRDEIGDIWLPDIYINMHGYPPHEWVQYFAGYSAWMTDRERDPGSNNYWIPRGYFLTGFSWYDHEDYPQNRELSFALLDSITTRVNAVPEMKAVNDEMQMRYRKYRSHEEGYGEFYYNGMWVNAPLRGRENTGSGFSNPAITYFTLTSEAPDEPARGDWMKMNAEAGLAHSTAILNYLYYGVNRVNYESSERGSRTLRRKYRIKPVLPEELIESENSD